jgi:hypothetical protein
VSYDPKLGQLGDFFFYYTPEAAFQHILPALQLRLSSALVMRDPLESNPALISAAWYVSDDPEAQRSVEATVMQASLELQQLRRCVKVLSLTIDALDYVGDADIFGRGYAPRPYVGAIRREAQGGSVSCFAEAISKRRCLSNYEVARRSLGGMR